VSSLGDAVAELVAWGQDRALWPSTACGLIDIVATGLADRGIAVPEGCGEPNGDWVADFYAAADELTRLDIPEGAAARTRDSLRSARDHAAYHCAAVQRNLGGLDHLRDGWGGQMQSKIRISVAELVSHLAVGFAMHGRVPHCSGPGRALLTGAIDHDGPDPYVPQRPPYRYAGALMAEVQLHFGLPIFVDTVDESVCPDIIRTGWWEPWIDGIVRKCVGRGDVAVNVGANVGYHTLLMANCVQEPGRVFGFEPNPRLVRLLQRSLNWAGLLAMTTLFPIAASNASGTCRFIASHQHMGGGRLSGAALLGNADLEELWLRGLRESYPNFDEGDLEALLLALKPIPEIFDVHTARLDDTVGRLAQNIHFLLIDAEGAEPLVLDGGQDLIRRSRDLAMIVEWSNGVTYATSPAQRAQAAATIDWLASDGFRFYRIGGDARDVYARPAILELMAPDEVINMEGYGDLFICRRPAR
jgi:FkbM family methyltransferase